MKTLLIAIFISMITAVVLMPRVGSAACDVTVSSGDDIKSKLESAPSGSEICIDPGSYSATSQINLSQGDLYIHGTSGCQFPVIAVSHSFTTDPQGPHGIAVKSSGITFENLEFHFDVPRDGISSEVPVSDIIVRNNTILGDAGGDECVELKKCTDCLAEHNDVSGCGGDAISIVDSSVDSIIQNNLMTNTGLNGSHGENGAIIIGSNQGLEITCNRIEGIHNRAGFQFTKYSSTPQSGVSIHHNLIVNNPLDFVTSSERGIFRWRSDGETTGLTIENNTVAYNGDATHVVHGVFLAYSKPTFTVGTENIFAFNTGFGMRSIGSPATAFTALDNDLFGNTLGIFSGPIIDSGNLFLDPSFDSDYVPTNPALAGYGWDPGACGTIGPVCAVCGDGVVESGEECDDGNTNNGDCCDATCQFEPNGSSCTDNNACTEDDQCDGQGACAAGTPVTCNDQDACTDDSCDSSSGTCTFTDNGTCGDGGIAGETEPPPGTGPDIGVGVPPVLEGSGTIISGCSFHLSASPNAVDLKSMLGLMGCIVLSWLYLRRKSAQ